MNNHVIILVFFIFNWAYAIADDKEIDLSTLDIAKFRGPDANNNTLDDEKIDKKISELHEDIYVQKLLTHRAVQLQRILENVDDLRIVKKALTESQKSLTCFTLMFDDPNYEQWGELNYKLSNIMYYNEERRTLLRMIDRNLSGEAISSPDTGQRMDNAVEDWEWRFYCPFSFAPGDRDKYYIPWKKRNEGRFKNRRQ